MRQHPYLWNERVELDPLLWMAEPFSDPEEFWASGERDLAQLTQATALCLPPKARVLELGCGIGRLIGPALEQGWQVVGLDTAEAALKIANTRYKNAAELKLIHSALPDIPANLGKFDLIFSWATLPHLAPDAFVATLLKIPELLNPNGRAALHVYVGNQNLFSADDDYSIRSYELGRLRKAVSLAGFDIRDEKKLILPFATDDEALNRVPLIFDLSLAEHAPASPNKLLETLVSEVKNQTSSTSLDAYRVLVTKMNHLIVKRDFAELDRYLNFARHAHPDRESEWQRLTYALKRLT